MMKNKKCIIAQVPKEQFDASDSDGDSYDSNDEIDNDNDDVYDSMIENGTSEEDSDDNDNLEEVEENKEEISNTKNLIKLNKDNKRKRNQEYEENNKIENMKSIKKLKSNKNLYKPPTIEEMNQLRETENLFHSNLFRMQINEMLKEIQIKQKYKNFINEWLNNLNKFIKNDLESMSIKEESKNLTWLENINIKIPFDITAIKNEKLFNFQFLKPIKDAFIIGSYKYNTLIGSILTIDICIIIPSKFYQKDDYLNLIYDKKRALYLTYLTWKINEKLSSTKYFHELKFNYFRNNPYKPILEIKPYGKIGEKLNFQLFLCPDDDTFKLNRFVPWNSNIRGSLFGDVYDKPENEPLFATPNYNATILYDLTMKRNHEYLENCLNQHQNLRDGLILLKIWLKQRNLDIGYCGFSNFIMSMYVVYLFKMKKLHTAMSSYQIARNTWNHLAISAWNEDGKGISLCDDYSQPNQPTLEQFHVYYDIVFIDTTGYLNLCANLSIDLYLKIKYESQRAIEFLNEKNLNSFQLLFMTKIPTFTIYDQVLKISHKQSLEYIIENYCEKSDKHNYAGTWYPLILKKITSVLRKGLGNRIISMIPIEIQSKSWNIEENPIKMRKYFYLGFILNHYEAFDVLNKGPQANNEDAAEEFRKFWGKKAKLRRFQDSSILEACAWGRSNEILSQKRNILQRIISYLLKHQFYIKYEKIHYFGTEFDKLYELNRLLYLLHDTINKKQIIDAESTTLKVIRSFDELSKNLRDLNDIPLDISSVQGISSVFRYCDPIPTLNNAKTYLNDNHLIFQSYKILDAVIQLGFSGKWPNELKAFRCIKTAFHIKIAQELRKKFKYETRGSIDGIYILKDGYVFRIEIAHQKEITLTKQEITDENNIKRLIDTTISLKLEKQFNIMPKLTSTLHGLYQRYTSYGPAVMITKRWLYSQLIDSYLWPDECTELLIASLYLKLNVYENSFNPQVGFLRFLNLLANTDWKNEMFLLNFNDGLTQEEITEIENRFNNERDLFPPLTIITSYDKNYTSIWTKNAPNIQILAHVTLLAKHAIKIIEMKFLQIPSIKIRDLFVPNLDGYDLIIRLRSDLIHTCLAECNLNLLSKNKKNINQIDSTVPAAGFDPIEIGLNELREGYSDFAVFFYNPCGGKEICILWKPGIFDEKDFKVTSVNGCILTKNGKLKCDRKILIEDFKIILKGLYHTIEDRLGSVKKENNCKKLKNIENDDDGDNEIPSVEENIMKEKKIKKIKKKSKVIT